MVTDNRVAELERRLALSEDEVDLLDFRLAEIEHIVAGGEFVPGEVVNRLVAGEHPVRVWRDHRGLSGAELARRAGISPALLSEIESGRKEGSLRTLRALARELHVDLDDLVPWNGGDDRSA
jgi:DNA-binding Xre family transcriptional regulator